MGILNMAMTEKGINMSFLNRNRPVSLFIHYTECNILKYLSWMLSNTYDKHVM